MRFISLPRLVASIIISFAALTFNNLWSIRADNNIFGYASLFLTTVQIFILVSLSYFVYQIFGGLKNSHKRMKLVIAAIIFIVGWFYFLIDLSPSYDFYTVNGSILANKYGINWFWMDWGVWIICTTVYSLGVYLYLVNLLIDLFPSAKANRQKKH